MKFNLNNEEYYCKYWKKYFETILSDQEYEKVEHKNNVEIGHYDFATKIGYGFPDSFARKKFVHKLYRGESYYPKSMLINYKWTKENQNTVKDFIGKSRKILKNNYGVGSKSIYLVNSVDDCLKTMNKKDFYIIQNEIDPLLHNGLKLDERVYYLVVKEQGTFSGYMFKEGHIKLAGFKFDKKSNEMGVFATNIKAPKPNGSDPSKFTIDTVKFLDGYEKSDLWKKNRLEVMEKISEKFLPVIAENTKKYYKGKKEPVFMWHLYGIDLLIDKNYNFYLCEFNGKPGVLFEDVMPKNITELNKNMCDRIAMNFLFPWIDGESNSCVSDKSIVKLGEFEF